MLTGANTGEDFLSAELSTEDTSDETPAAPAPPRTVMAWGVGNFSTGEESAALGAVSLATDGSAAGSAAGVSDTLDAVSTTMSAWGNVLLRAGIGWVLLLIAILVQRHYRDQKRSRTKYEVEPVNK